VYLEVVEIFGWCQIKVGQETPVLLALHFLCGAKNHVKGQPLAACFGCFSRGPKRYHGTTCLHGLWVIVWVSSSARAKKSGRDKHFPIFSFFDGPKKDLKGHKGA